VGVGAVYFRPVLTSPLDVGVWSASHPSHFIPGDGYRTHWVRILVGPRGGLDVVEKGVSCRPRESHPDSSTVLPTV
jgi:hypothetical protein